MYNKIHVTSLKSIQLQIQLSKQIKIICCGNQEITEPVEHTLDHVRGSKLESQMGTPHKRETSQAAVVSFFLSVSHSLSGKKE